jgi:hypothetical protein
VIDIVFSLNLEIEHPNWADYSLNQTSQSHGPTVGHGTQHAPLIQTTYIDKGATFRPFDTNSSSLSEVIRLRRIQK